MKTPVSHQFVLLLRPVLHVIGIVLVYWGIILLRGYTDLIPFVQLRIPVIDLQETLLFAFCSAIIFLTLWFVHHLYGLFRPSQQGYGTFFQTRILWLMISGFLAWIGFGYVFVSGISRFIVLVACGVSFFVILFIDRLWSRCARRRWKEFVYRLLILSADHQKADRIATEFTDHSEYATFPCAIADLDAFHETRHGCVVVGAVDEHWLQQRNEQCRITGKDVYQLAEGHFFEHSFGVPMTIGPLVVTSRRSSPLTERWRVVKRWWDIFFSFFGLLGLTPVFLGIALLIKATSPWPVFYIQERVGKQKRLFRFVKFRSMYTHLSTGAGYGGEEAERLYEQLIHSDQNIRVGILPKIAHDPRVTPVGRWLRKTSLDELPSLWSVLMGDMSLVWPRPHLPREVAQYTDRQQRLFHLKPWITWYAQLYGRDKVPFDEEAKLDLRYMQHRSLRLDIYVLFATLKVIFGGK